MGYGRQTLMKLAPVNGLNVSELVFVPEMDAVSTYFNFRTISGRWTSLGMSYKHYCHHPRMVKSVVQTPWSSSSNLITNVGMSENLAIILDFFNFTR